jgi:hypothetical protein
MKRIGIILIGIFVWGILVLSQNAVAHTSHAGIHAQSPFDAPKVKKSLHCMLKKHHSVTQPLCPHTKQGRSAEIQLKADCDNHPSGTQIQTSWSKILMISPSIGKASSAVKKYFLTPRRFGFPSPFHDRLEKPPQHA